MANKHKHKYAFRYSIRLPCQQLKGVGVEVSIGESAKKVISVQLVDQEKISLGWVIAFMICICGLGLSYF